MAMSFRQPHAKFTQSTDSRGSDWFGTERAELVTITLEADSLSRLLRQHELYVEDFCCADESSRGCVRRMLLQLLSKRG